MAVHNAQCICQNCKNEIQYGFDIDNVPAIDTEFVLFCPSCKCEQVFQYKETKKISAERKHLLKEKELQSEIKRLAEKYGFSCEFIYQSVTIKTPCGSWRFDYHNKTKNLFHESTYKFNLKSKNESFWHRQFTTKMSVDEILKYIDNHEKATMKRIIKKCNSHAAY